jgi:hypothetical protein
MNRSAIKTMPLYFDRYINLVDDIDINDALTKYGQQYIEAEQDKLRGLGDEVYAPGKWSVKDIIQHITDTERIFAYRALRIARADKTPLPGFDENHYAAQTTASTRSLDDLLNEFYAVRATTIMLFKSFSPDMLLNEGISSGNPVSVLALGFTTAGHVIHHMNVLKERYYPLLK